MEREQWLTVEVRADESSRFEVDQVCFKQFVRDALLVLGAVADLLPSRLRSLQAEYFLQCCLPDWIRSIRPSSAISRTR